MHRRPLLRGDRRSVSVGAWKEPDDAAAPDGHRTAASDLQPVIRIANQPASQPAVKSQPFEAGLNGLSGLRVRGNTSFYSSGSIQNLLHTVPRPLQDPQAASWELGVGIFAERKLDAAYA